MEDNYYIVSIITITFLIGYTVSQLRKPLVLNPTIISIFKFITFITTFFNSNNSPKIELSDDRKILFIQLNNINFYIRKLIKTKLDIKVYGDNSELIEIGKYLDYYFGLDISPSCFGFNTFKIVIKPTYGKFEERTQTIINKEMTIYDFLSSNPNLISEPFKIHKINNENIIEKTIIIEDNASEQE